MHDELLGDESGGGGEGSNVCACTQFQVSSELKKQRQKCTVIALLQQLGTFLVLIATTMNVPIAAEAKTPRSDRGEAF
jgi:hypothetical protein